MQRKLMIPLLSWVLVILWMVVIYRFSAQGGAESGSLSREIIEVLVNLVKKVVPSAEINMDLLHLLLRKTAHFSVYLVLGMFVLNALHKSGCHERNALIAAFLVCVLYAAGDEIHQLFVPGRSGQIMDVLIDSCGGITGIFLLNSIRKNYRIKSG